MLFIALFIFIRIVFTGFFFLGTHDRVYVQLRWPISMSAVCRRHPAPSPRKVFPHSIRQQGKKSLAHCSMIYQSPLTSTPAVCARTCIPASTESIKYKIFHVDTEGRETKYIIKIDVCLLETLANRWTELGVCSTHTSALGHSRTFVVDFGRRATTWTRDRDRERESPSHYAIRGH